MPQGDAFGYNDVRWGRVRVQDMIVTLQWLYEKHPRDNAQLLRDNMQWLYDGSYKWEAWYNEAVYLRQDVSNAPEEVREDNLHYLHGVNIGMGQFDTLLSN